MVLGVVRRAMNECRFKKNGDNWRSKFNKKQIHKGSSI